MSRRAPAPSGATAGSASSSLAPDAPLHALPGVGLRTAQRLQAVGLARLFDLALLFPRRARGLRDLAAPDEHALGELVRLEGQVHNVAAAWLPGRRSMVTVRFACAGGSTFDVPFFNQPWMKKNFVAGQRRAVEGVLQKQGRRFVLHQARVQPAGAAPDSSVQLHYPEVDGVSAARLAGWIAHVLDQLDWSLVTLDALPAGLEDLQATPRALLLAMHRPVDVAEHERARRHFAVREALQLFARVEKARQARAERPAQVFPVDATLAERIRARIPFVLTDDQQRAVQALWQRLAGPAAMGVLLQGDVGTGKTAVAVAAALAVLARGADVAFLSPTELLAEQHHAAVSRWLQGSEIEVVLCTGSQRLAAVHRRARLIFGTHALLAQDVVFGSLGLVVVDEQHRFGVQQRMTLVQKGQNPHVLVMTATPIPRTLALTLFGDLDALTLATRPQGRPGVRALHVAADRWPRVVRSIGRAVRRGGRVFVVCPAVGEDGAKGGVQRVFDALRERFRCASVHGRLKAAERQRAVAAFRAGEIDVLVGTTVLEVGVDVPAATLMVVVAADRFGIATLHQLRGRVGRGARRGLALLCGARTARVDAVCQTTDGFELAERDLALRGSGELLGTQQSGFSELRALDPVEDLALLRRVRDAARGAAVPVIKEAQA